MSLSYTKSTLKKLELLFEELNYRIRYERGNFKSGYCIVNSSQMILINKYFETKARIESLVDILSQVEIHDTELTEQSQSILEKVLKMNILADKLVA